MIRAQTRLFALVRWPLFTHRLGGSKPPNVHGTLSISGASNSGSHSRVRAQRKFSPVAESPQKKVKPCCCRKWKLHTPSSRHGACVARYVQQNKKIALSPTSFNSSAADRHELMNNAGFSVSSLRCTTQSLCILCWRSTSPRRPHVTDITR